MVGTDDSAFAGESHEQAIEVEAAMAAHEAALLRYAIRILNNPDAAQDVVQDTFIKMCRRWRDGVPRGTALKSWLYRVAHNQAVDHIRKENRLRLLHQKQAEEVPPVYNERPCGELHEKERKALALEHVRTLKPEEQQIVLLRLQEGLSYREISRVTRRSEGNVGCILHHAVKKLAMSLKRAGVV